MPRKSQKTANSNQSRGTSSALTVTKEQRKKEKEGLDIVYNHIKRLMNYPENFSLTTYAVLRIKGLAQGCHYARSREKQELVYGYELIEETLNLFESIIKKIMSQKVFENDTHKINFILKFIENNLNNTYTYLSNKKLSEEHHAQEQKQIDKMIDDIDVETNKHIVEDTSDTAKALQKQNEDLW